MSLLSLFNKKSVTPISVNTGMFYNTTVSTLANTSGIFYSSDIYSINKKNGVFYSRTIYNIINNSGILYDHWTPIEISTNNGIFYLNNFQLFTFLENFIYKKSDLLVAINQCADDATAITITIQGYELPYTYYEQIGYADKLVVDTSQINTILADPESVTIILTPPFTIDSNTINHSITETRSIEYSPYSASYSSTPIEIRNINDNFVTSLDINYTTNTLDYTSDTYTLWYGRYYSEDLDSPIFVNTSELPTGVTIKFTINSKEYTLFQSLLQLPVFTPDSSDTFTIEVIADTTFTDTVAGVSLNFYTMKSNLTSTNITDTTLTNQKVNASFTSDYTFNLSIFHSTSTSLITALLGDIVIGIGEDKHI